MSKSFFEEFQLPEPNKNLAIGSGAHGEQTGKMITGIENFFREVRPDWVLAYGDTNSTIAGALAAAKMGIPIAHIEAGLRSGDRSMPEEINRVLTDHASELCLAPTEAAMRNLEKEGLIERSRLTGDVMVDVLRRIETAVTLAAPDLPWDISKRYVVATLHRQALMESREKLVEVISALGLLNIPIFLVAHPRLSTALELFGILPSLGAKVSMVDPLNHHEMVYAVKNAAGVITDSGGLQKEAYLLGTPCLTVRETTEWPETLQGGWNRLVWNNFEHLANGRWLDGGQESDDSPFGSGDAAAKIVQSIEATG